MATEGELNYFESIGDVGRSHSIAKPFSEDDRGAVLLEVGAVLSLLPRPPASILDCGCGTGWFTWLLQRCGYEATGIDVAPKAIDLAASNAPYTGTKTPRFMVGDVEGMDFEQEFDAVVFFDSLHHTVDEQAALRGALRALKPNGICITSEPGAGHAAASEHQIASFGVTERDMPASHIASVARTAGFSKSRIYPRADSLGVRLYESPPAGPRHWKARVRSNRLIRSLLVIRTLELAKRDNGIVVLTAPNPK